MLESLEALAARGFKEANHRMPNVYYERLLGRHGDVNKKRPRSTVVDDMADMLAPGKNKLKGLGDRGHDPGIPHPLDNGLLMLEDGEEGEDEALDELTGIDGLRVAVDQAKYPIGSASCLHI